MPRLILTVVSLALMACAARTVTAPRTTPVVDATRREVDAQSRSVLVLSAASLSPATAPAEAVRLGDPVATSIPTEWVERSLLDGGWNPVPHAAVAQLVARHSTAVALRDVLVRMDSSLADVADVLGPVSSADSVLVVREWRTTWEPVAGAYAGGRHLCCAAGELGVQLRSRGGALLWEARAFGRASDFADLQLTGRGRSAMVSHPDASCAGNADCSSCPDALPGAVVARLARSLSEAVVAELNRSTVTQN